MSNYVYMAETAWKSLLDAIRSKTGSQAKMTVSDATAAVSALTPGAEINDASYLFYQGARTDWTERTLDAGILGAIKKPKNMTYFAYSNYHFFECDLSGVDFSACTNMANAFYGCSYATKIDLGDANFPAGVNFNSAFYGCPQVDALNFPTAIKPAGSLYGLFDGCGLLKSLDLSSFDTSSVDNMQAIFQSCEALESIDISSFDTSNVTSFNSMFYACKHLTDIDLSNFAILSTKNANIGKMFYNCSRLEKVTFGPRTEVLGNGAGNVNFSPLYGCNALKTLRIKATTPPTLTGTHVLMTAANTVRLEHIYVPAAAVADYKAATNWSFFEDIIEADPEEE